MSAVGDGVLGAPGPSVGPAVGGSHTRKHSPELPRRLPSQSTWGDPEAHTGRGDFFLPTIMRPNTSPDLGLLGLSGSPLTG